MYILYLEGVKSCSNKCKTKSNKKDFENPFRCESIVGRSMLFFTNNAFYMKKRVHQPGGSFEKLTIYVLTYN